MVDEVITTMRAVVHERHGDPGQVLRLDESIPVMAPGRGEVLVRVSVRPVHPGDIAIIAGGGDGTQLPRPRVPGFEGAGVVAAVGPDVTDLEPGQRVALFLFPTPGAWGEYVITSPAAVVPVPDEIDDATASMMLIYPLTARMLLRAAEDSWSAPARPTIQTAAGSSVGGFIAAEAETYAYPFVNLVRSPEGAAKLTDRFPSIPTFTTSEAEWPAQVREVFGGPAGVAIDAVGGSLAYDLLNLLEDGGTLISYGALSGSTAPLEDGALVERNLQTRNVSVGGWGLLGADLKAADMAFALEMARTRSDLFDVAASYDLSEFAAAVEDVGRPGKAGTVLLTSVPG